MARTIEIKTNAASAEISVDDDNVTELYADAIAEQMIGVPVSKLLFYVGTGAKDGKLNGKAVFRLTIPTSTLLDLARNLLSHIEQNEKQLNSALSVYENSLTKKITDN